MALQSFQLDPAAGGVSQAEYDAHTHNYRRVDSIGIDADLAYGSPDRATVIDDSEVSASDAKPKSVGIAVSTQPTDTPA